MAIVDELITLLKLEADKKNEAETTRTERNLQRVAKAAAAVATAFASIATAALNQVRITSNRINELAAEADRAGLSFEAFQELSFAAEKNQVSIDALTDGIKELQLRADEFVETGKGPAADAFKRLGLTASQLKDQLAAPDVLFENIIDRLRTLDTAAQIRIADEIFGGTGGEQFVRFLSDGTKSVAELRAELRALGGVIPDEAKEEAKRYRNALTDVQRAIRGLADNVAIRFIPVLTKASLNVKDFIIANRELISDKLDEFISGVFQGFRDVAGVISGLLTPVKSLADGFGELAKELDLTGLYAAGVKTSFLGVLAGFIAIAWRWIPRLVKRIGILGGIWILLTAIIEDVDNYLKGHGSLIGELVEKYPELEKVINRLLEVIEKIHTTEPIDWARILGFDDFSNEVISFLNEIERRIRDIKQFLGIEEVPEVQTGPGKTGRSPRGMTFFEGTRLESGFELQPGNIADRIVDFFKSLVPTDLELRMQGEFVPPFTKEGQSLEKMLQERFGPKEGEEGEDLRSMLQRIADPVRQVASLHQSVTTNVGGVSVTIHVNGAGDPGAVARRVKAELDASITQQTISPGLGGPVVS